MKQKTFRILSIDGGGIRGIIPAKVLAELEDVLVKKGQSPHLHEHFDLICGTSTGAILAIGLALGIPASELLKFYKTHAKLIFPRWPIPGLEYSKLLYGPLYSNTALQNTLEKVYSQNCDGRTALLSDAKTNLCIPTFNGGAGEINVLKTKHHPEYIRDYMMPAHHVALSSASAPIYFPPHSFSFPKGSGTGTNLNMVDGGIFANNPTLIGVFEATDKFGKDFNEIEILSIGTGKGKHVLKQRWKHPSLRYWFFPKPRVLDIILDCQAQVTEQYIHFMNRSLAKTGNSIGYCRVQHDFGHDPISLNSSRKKDITLLEAVGDELAKKNMHTIINQFFNNQ